MQVTHVNLSKPKYNAIILLGNHGIGKDTLANRLIKYNPEFVNIKMSRMYKDFLRLALTLNENEINGTDVDKIREKPIDLSTDFGADYKFPFSVLDVLNLLFHGSKVDSRFVATHVEYALEKIPNGKIPVFTDIRRTEEYQEVCHRFLPLVIHLVDKEVKPGETDEQIETLAKLSPDTVEIELTRAYTSHGYTELLTTLKPFFNVYYDKRFLLDDYCLKLFTLNESRIPTKTGERKDFVSHMLFGLIEELTEYHLSANFDEAKAEAGDVMAYLALALYGCCAIGYPKEEAANYIGYIIENSFGLKKAEEKYSACTLHELINNLAGKAKRYLREGRPIEASDILGAYVWLLKKIEALGLDLKDVLDYNIEKLTKRASTGNLFQGSGSDR